jgi:autotransporter-associated beta strand protein
MTAGSNVTVLPGGRFNLAGGSANAFSQTIGSLSGAGIVTKDAAATAGNSAVLTIDGGDKTTSTTFSGVIQNGTGSATGTLSLTKTGSTTQILSGDNTYTGQTRIDGGTLLINGTHIEAAAVSGLGYNGTANGHYLVGSGATLGGSGRIAGNNATTNANMILVLPGGHLAPGNNGDGSDDIGTLTLDGANISGSNAHLLNMDVGAEFDFRLAADGSGTDQLVFLNYVSGDLVLNNNTVNLSLAPGAAQAASGYTVNLFAFFSDDGQTVVASGITDGSLVVKITGEGIEDATLVFNEDGSIGLTDTVTATAVPEPATWASVLGGLALACVLLRRRHCRRASR